MVLIYDDGRGDFGPLTDRRAAFDLRTGALTTRQRIEALAGQRVRALAVPPALAQTQRCREAEAGGEVAVLAVSEAGGPGPTAAAAKAGAEAQAARWNPGATLLVVNGRWSGGPALPRALDDLPPDHAVVQPPGEVIAARLTGADAEAFIAGGFTELPAGVTAHPLEPGALLERPWHILDQLDAALGRDLDPGLGPLGELPEAEVGADRTVRGRPGVYVESGRAVRIAADAVVRPGAVLNAEAGPIVIDRRAVVHPGVALEGPCYLGPGVVLGAHAWVRPGTAIGPGCKIGGEVSACLIHAHTNKSHLGYLGNAIVGQWCNLGADTNASNLKNTYGPVRIGLRPREPAQDTGRTIQGPILGDLVRTAIGTRLHTGTVVGTGSMIALAGFAPKCVGALRFLTDGPGGSVSDQPHRVDKLIAAAQAMHARRGLPFPEHESRHLRELALREAPGDGS